MAQRQFPQRLAVVCQERNQVLGSDVAPRRQMQFPQIWPKSLGVPPVHQPHPKHEPGSAIPQLQRLEIPGRPENLQHDLVGHAVFHLRTDGDVGKLELAQVPDDFQRLHHLCQRHPHEHASVHRVDGELLDRILALVESLDDAPPRSRRRRLERHRRGVGLVEARDRHRLQVPEAWERCGEREDVVVRSENVDLVQERLVLRHDRRCHCVYRYGVAGRCQRYH